MNDKDKRDDLDGAFGENVTNRVLGFSKRTKFILGAIVVAVVVTLTSVLAIQYITPHYTVDEFFGRPITPEGQFIAVEGSLVPQSYRATPDGTVSTFSLVDEGGNETISVTYGRQAGADVGQLFFNEHSTILVQGRKVGQNEFEATRLTVKCPTKYQTDEENYEEINTSASALD